MIDSGPDALTVEATWQPGGKAPRTHWHPHQAEHFMVLDGELTVLLGDEGPRVVAAGGAFDVPARTAHAMWNAGDDPCRATWRVTPARRTEQMFRTIDAGLNPVRAVRMLWVFRHEFRLGRPRG